MKTIFRICACSIVLLTLSNTTLAAWGDWSPIANNVVVGEEVSSVRFEGERNSRQDPCATGTRVTRYRYYGQRAYCVSKYTANLGSVNIEHFAEGRQEAYYFPWLCSRSLSDIIILDNPEDQSIVAKNYGSDTKMQFAYWVSGMTQIAVTPEISVAGGSRRVLFTLPELIEGPGLPGTPGNVLAGCRIF